MGENVSLPYTRFVSDWHINPDDSLLIIGGFITKNKMGNYCIYPVLFPCDWLSE